MKKPRDLHKYTSREHAATQLRAIADRVERGPDDRVKFHVDLRFWRTEEVVTAEQLHDRSAHDDKIKVVALTYSSEAGS